MFISKNLLSLDEQRYIKDLMDNEISKNLAIDTNIPLYQSYANMHLKYSNDYAFQKLINSMLANAGVFYNKDFIIENCWFNICKEDSKFTFHRHAFPVAGVYYLQGCDKEGTIFEINNGVQLQFLSENNSAFFFDPAVAHRVPYWKGQDRYSIAFDLVIKR